MTTGTMEAGDRLRLLGSLLMSDGDRHAPNRAERLQPRTHRAGLDMSQLSMRPQERSQCSTARKCPIQASPLRHAPYMRFRHPVGPLVVSLRLGPTGAVPAKLGT